MVGAGGLVDVSVHRPWNRAGEEEEEDGRMGRLIWRGGGLAWVSGWRVGGIWYL